MRDSNSNPNSRNPRLGNQIAIHGGSVSWRAMLTALIRLMK